MPNFSVRLFDETNLKRSRLLRRSPAETPRNKLALASIFTLETAPQSRLYRAIGKNANFGPYQGSQWSRNTCPQMQTHSASD